MDLAWLSMRPSRTAKVSPWKRRTPASSTDTTGEVSGFSTAWTMVRSWDGVIIQCRPALAMASWAARTAAGIRFQMPMTSRPPSMGNELSRTVTISAWRRNTVSRRSAGAQSTAFWPSVVRPPSTMRMRMGLRSGHVPGHAWARVGAAPGRVVNDGPADNGSGRYGMARSSVSRTTYSPVCSGPPLASVVRSVGVAAGSGFTTAAPGPGIMYDPASRAAMSNWASMALWAALSPMATSNMACHSASCTDDFGAARCRSARSR